MMTQKQIEERIAFYVDSRYHWSNLLSAVRTNDFPMSKASLDVANIYIESCTIKIDELNYILSYNQ
jgi:hypothetical protein